MQLTEIDYPDAQPIESYGPDFFRIGDDKIAAPALVHAKSARLVVLLLLLSVRLPLLLVKETASSTATDDAAEGGAAVAAAAEVEEAPCSR